MNVFKRCVLIRTIFCCHLLIVSCVTVAFAKTDIGWKKLFDNLSISEDSKPVLAEIRFKLDRPDGVEGLGDISWDVIHDGLKATHAISLFERIAEEKWRQTDFGDLIRIAGNEDDDAIRLRHLKRISYCASQENKDIKGLSEMISGIDMWINSKNLVYFHGEVRKTADFDFQVDANSPLYPIACLYRARMLVWVTTNYGTVESDNLFLNKALDLFRLGRAAFPENRIIRMYLGEVYPPEKDYPAVANAPRWAVWQREGIERLADIIEWWIDHRLQENGEYGGGWGDDCEMWRVWVPVLIGFDDPKISQAQSYFSQQLLDQPHLRGGYMNNRMTDVEHSAEDVADVLTPMMHLDQDNPEWSDRALKLTSLMKDVWTGTNQRGFFQFKSTYFNIDTVDTNRVKACDTVYHPRAVQPALLYWQRTGDTALGELFTGWMDTWADAAVSSERGKPAGMLPTAIHWPEGYVGGIGENWWDPKNHPSETRLYGFPSAMSMMCNTLLLTYYMSGDVKYLEPVKSMAQIRLDYLIKKPDKLVPGSASWCAERIGFIADTAAKYRHLTGSSEFDELLLMENRPYVRYRMLGDEQALEEGLRRTAEALRINSPGYTSEVRYTDRVVRFPSIYRVLENGPSFPVPNLRVLYNSITGDYGDVGYFPVNAVRWLTPPRDIAALVTDNGNDRFTAELFHFGGERRGMKAELYLLDPGNYSVTVLSKDDMKEHSVELIEVTGKRTVIDFELPPESLCLMRVRRQ
ncbi:hypothetical protein ACFL47_05035 [Candidatus Latescibacterota bacterium]